MTGPPASGLFIHVTTSGAICWGCHRIVGVDEVVVKDATTGQVVGCCECRKESPWPRPSRN